MTESRSHQDIQLFDQDSPRAAELLRELHDEVLFPSFPANEYIPPTTIDPQDGLAVIACSAGRVVGGALGEVYPASNALLLGYLAARPGLRGSGVGSALLGRAQGALAGRASADVPRASTTRGIIRRTLNSGDPRPGCASTAGSASGY